MAQAHKEYISKLFQWREKSPAQFKKMMIISCFGYSVKNEPQDINDLYARGYAFLPIDFENVNVRFLPNRIVHTFGDQTIATEFLLIELTGDELNGNEDESIKKIERKIAFVMKKYQFYSPKQNPTFNTLLYFPNTTDWPWLKETDQSHPLHRSIIVGTSILQDVLRYYVHRNYQNYATLTEEKSSSGVFD